MTELYQANDSINPSHLEFSETDIPEPVEPWSLEDFEDLLPDSF